MFRSEASAVAPGATEIMMPKVVGTVPEFLAAAISRAVRAGGSWQDVADRVAAVLRRQLPGPGLLTPGQLAGDPAGYQTHLVHAEPDGSFSVGVMVWLPASRPRSMTTSRGA